MEKERRLGKKNEYGIDKPMYIKTKNWEIITNNDIVEIVDSILDNEENIYPRTKDFIGCEFFLGELNEIFKKYGYGIIRKEKDKLDEWM